MTTTAAPPQQRRTRAGNRTARVTARVTEPTPAPPAAAEDLELQTYVEQAPLSVLQCRDLRHAWPRAQPQSGRTPRGVPDSIAWQVLAKRPSGSWERAQRTMWCTGGCGTRRVEVFYFRPDHTMLREGRPLLRYPRGYRRRRAEPDTPLAPLDSEILRGAVVGRLYPNLRW